MAEDKPKKKKWAKKTAKPTNDMAGMVKTMKKKTSAPMLRKKMYG